MQWYERTIRSRQKGDCALVRRVVRFMWISDGKCGNGETYLES